jgi:aspartyl-tRNA(Asn)/glutamyl-tRNA(Gln) amidotransferase subunit A
VDAMSDRQNDRQTRRTWFAGVSAIATQLASASGADVASDPLAWSLSEAAAALAKRQISSEELTKLCLARIRRLDRQLNAFITLNGDAALAHARECDRSRVAGRKSGRLHGIPIALKDNIDTAGIRTTRAHRFSRIVFLRKTRKSRNDSKPPA